MGLSGFISAHRESGRYAAAICRLSPLARLLLLPACFSLLSALGADAVSTNWMRVGVDVDAEVGLVSFTDQQAISIGLTKPDEIMTLDFAGAERVGIDALMVRSNTIFFSPDAGFSVDADAFADEDVVAYHATEQTYSMFFDGSAHGLPPGANLDAVCFEPGTTNLLFSLDTTISIPGEDVDDEDIFLFESGDIMVYADGSTLLGIPPQADLDALSCDEDHLFFSLDVTATLNGHTGTDKDIWVYHEAGSFVTLLRHTHIESRADLAALDDPNDADGDWLTDFEESTGQDEAVTTYPGTTFELGPNGFKSNPSMADSDGDGMHDGREAACGTDPYNDADYLRVTAIASAPGGEVVTWASVAGKEYDVEAAPSLTAPGGGPIMTGIEAHGASTSVTNHSGVSVYFYRVSLNPGF